MKNTTCGRCGRKGEQRFGSPCVKCSESLAADTLAALTSPSISEQAAALADRIAAAQRDRAAIATGGLDTTTEAAA